MKTVKRFDISAIDFMQEDVNGFLKGDGVVTRIGVFTYVNPDGTLRKELRHPDDILRIDSLNTMRMIPIVDGHPQDMVTPMNAKDLSVGNVGENIRPDGSHIIASVMIIDGNMIEKVHAGQKALSLGYKVDLAEENGEYDGIRYDFRQTNVRYNHLAIVSSARAGNGARLKFDEMNLDADDAILLLDEEDNDYDWDSYSDDEFQGDVRKCPREGHQDRTTGLRKALKALGKRKSINKGRIRAGKKPILGGKEVQLSEFLKKTSMTKGMVKKIKKGDSINPKQEVKRMDSTFNIDGIGYSCAPEVTNFINKLQTKHDAIETDLSTKLDEIDVLKTEKDTTTAERDDARAKLKVFEEDDNTEEIQKRVKERVDIMQIAEKVISDGIIKVDKKDVKLDDATNVDLKKGVILSQYPDAKFDEKSDDYINARYDAVVETLSKNGIKSQKKSVAPSSKKDVDEDHVDADEARGQMEKDMKSAHAPKKD